MADGGDPVVAAVPSPEKVVEEDVEEVVVEDGGGELAEGDDGEMTVSLLNRKVSHDPSLPPSLPQERIESRLLSPSTQHCMLVRCARLNN